MKFFCFKSVLAIKKNFCKLEAKGREFQKKITVGQDEVPKQNTNHFLTRVASVRMYLCKSKSRIWERRELENDLSMLQKGIFVEG